MNLFTLFLIFSKLILVVTSLSVDEDMSEIIELTTTEMILRFGYPLEVHTVETTDGYILDLHRIPHGKNNKTSKRFAPVIIYAGVLADSACFACWPPESSIAYILADQGYDVWLGNTRGTTHGKRHIKWDPYKDKNKFWNFSFQEMATYDVPEGINYVLNITRSKNLYYIGHSQGSTIAFAMLAEKPNYNKKIRLLITLAPLVNMKHSTLPVFQFARKDFLYFKKYFPFVLSNLPAGASVKQLVHYGQLQEEVFQKYDHGKEKNLKIYNSEIPPVYNLSNIRAQTAIFYGTHDVISAYQDVNILAAKLPKLIYKKEIKGFNHVDLLYGTDTNNLINTDIVNLFKMH